MEEYQKRMIEEHDSLTIKISKLEDFINSSNVFKTLSIEDREDMRNQLHAMILYENFLYRILKRNILLFNE
jgi:hypothetical protein